MSTSISHSNSFANTQQMLPASVMACHTAEFGTFWLPPSTAIVTAAGELDAANATEFVEYAWRAGQVERLILDLTGIEFFGTAGVSALQTLGVRCAADRAEWALVPSKAVTRVLSICDPDTTLPVQRTIEAAYAAMSSESPPLLQLVAQTR